MIYIKKHSKKILLTAFIILAALTVWVFWANTALELNTHRISSSRLPSEFDGFRIAQISDLHNTQIGKNNIKLIELLKKADPNIIVITGDIADSRRTNIDISLKVAEEAVKIAPCYYVTGNHEARISEYKELKEGLSELDVIILEDEKTEYKLSNEKISIIGVNDPSFEVDYLSGDSESVIDEKLEELTTKDDSYTILLSHRPELFEVYVEHKIDLVFSGHAHGGQFRLPFIGGLFAPNQGFFPKYDGGVYTEDNTNMIVSRGIGASAFPLRFNNRPEIVLVELHSISED